jgi:hypothetical protein
MTKRHTDDRHERNREGGYALFAVTMFVFVVIIGSVAVFSTTSSETILAHHDLEKVQALFLADGAVERARARLSSEIDWRDGWTNESLGDGTYSLTISDTTINSLAGVKMLADGTVGTVRRRLEVVAQTPPADGQYATYAGEDLYVSRHLFVEPGIHVRGTSNIDSDDLRNGDLTTGPNPSPPRMHTEPSHWPDTTFYRVVPMLSGSTPYAVVLDRDGNDITSTMSRNIASVMTYDSSTQTFSYDFTGNSDVSDWFDVDSGVFVKSPGDGSVVVDFGQAAGTAPFLNARSDIYMAGSASVDLDATIINTRFIGSSDAQRTDSSYWTGGDVHMSHIDLTPDNGVSIVAHNYSVDGPRVFMGRNDEPALIFTTADFLSLSNTDHLNGALVALGNVRLGRTHHYTFDPDLFSMLPGFMVSTWPGNGGVMLNIVSWREIPLADG